MVSMHPLDFGVHCDKSFSPSTQSMFNNMEMTLSRAIIFISTFGRMFSETPMGQGNRK